jgi:hypothetical protein
LASRCTKTTTSWACSRRGSTRGSARARACFRSAALSLFFSACALASS